MQDSSPKRLRVAMVVIDANEVAGEGAARMRLPSPCVHPAIQGVINGLARKPEIELHVVYARSGGDERTTRFEKEGVAYHGVASRRLPLPGMGGGMLGRGAALHRYIRNLAPDVVHGQGTEREAGLVAAFSCFPSVITLHGNFRELRKVFNARLLDYHWCAAHLETLALRRTRGIICISKYVQRITACFQKQQFLVPNPIDSKFLAIEKAGRPAEALTVIFMGSLDGRKRPHFVLDVCEMLWKKGLVFRLDVFGGLSFDSDYSEGFLARLKPYESAGLARYCGYTAEPERVISEASIMISASIEESFGMNVLEAMSVGVPVVAPRVGGIEDLLAGDCGGRTFDPDSQEECANLLEAFLLSDERRNAYGNAGRQRVVEQYAPDVIASATISAYRAVLKTARAGF